MTERFSRRDSAATESRHNFSNGSVRSVTTPIVLLCRTIAKLLQRKKRARGPHGAVFLFFGAILPVAAIVFELVTHFCARHFFDPFPSTNHVLLFCLIPLSNLLVWLSGRRDLTPYYGFMSLISGMGMGIACLYALMFLPIAPLACFCIVFFGFGLLGLSPLLAIPCTWLGGKTVCRLASGRDTYFDAHQVEHIGHLIVLIMVVAVELPSTLTRMHLSLASQPATAQQGIHWLRRFGNQEVMLRACYERSGRATDILGSLYETAHPVGIENARKIFYTVTGKPFNTVPIPKSARSTIQHAGLIESPIGNVQVKDEFDLDTDIAGETVSGVSRGLSLSDSSIEGTIDGSGCLAKLQWAMTFSNVSQYDREARAKLRLPAGAAVSQAVLIVNGHRHIAQCMLRQNARTYYRRAVAERKNPLLVSSCGTDEVLVQCFPIVPKSSVEVRLEIVVALPVDEQKMDAVLVLPAIDERNFQADVPTKINLRSYTKVISVPTVARAKAANGESIGIAVTSGDAGMQAITGIIDAETVARLEAAMRFDRDSKVTNVFCRDSSSNPIQFIQRYLQERSFKRPQGLLVVIDGSAAMRPLWSTTVQSLAVLPHDMPVELLLVGDTVVKPEASQARVGNLAWQSALDALSKYDPVGGHDNYLPLCDALTNAARTNRSVLWIHGAQPITLKERLGIRAAEALLAAGTGDPLLYNLQVVAGPDEVLADVQADPRIVDVEHVGSIQADMERLARAWSASPSLEGDNQSGWQCKVLPSEDMLSPPGSLEIDTGLAQAWALHRVLEDIESGHNQEACIIASRYHIVSPVSSAVVTDEIPQMVASRPSPLRRRGWGPLPIGKATDTGGVWGLLGQGDQLSTANKLKESTELRQCEQSKQWSSLATGNFGSYSRATSECESTDKNLNEGVDSGLSEAQADSEFQQDAPSPAKTMFQVTAAPSEPVPEPETWALLCAVGMILSMVIWRERHRRYGSARQ